MYNVRVFQYTYMYEIDSVKKLIIITYFVKG